MRPIPVHSLRTSHLCGAAMHAGPTVLPAPTFHGIRMNYKEIS